MPTRKRKTFDCVGMKRAIQAKIWEEIKDLPPDAEIAYFNAPSGDPDLDAAFARMPKLIPPGTVVAAEVAARLFGPPDGAKPRRRRNPASGRARPASRR